MERLLTFAEISTATGIPEATLRYWRHQGEGPESFRIGRRVYVPESKYREWFEQMTTSQRGADGGTHAGRPARRATTPA